MAYIGLDVGTAGCKASVMDVNGIISAYKYQEYKLSASKPGYAEIDANLVWAAVKNVLQQIAIDHKDIRALAIASFGEAVVLLDKYDRVLDKSIFYSDIRGTDEVSDILSLFEREKVQELTGMPINPMYSANKLMWIKKHNRDTYDKAAKIMLFGDYIAYMLTGEAAIDFSLASRTMLLDIKKEIWAGEFADALGLDTSRFSRLVRSGTPIAYISPKVSADLGFENRVLLVAGGHDQPLAALGAGAVFAGDSVDGMGSSECITMVLNKDSISPQMYAHNFCCEPFVLKDRYITLAFNTSSGTSIKWYRDCIERERADAYEQTGKNLFADLDAECGDEPSPLLFLPHVLGSGTPYMDASMGGALFGIRMGTVKEQIYRAVLEGICFEMMQNIELLGDCGIDLKELTAVGGASKSCKLMQIKADIMNCEIKTLQSVESGTIGLGILCGYALGDYKDIESTAKLFAKTQKVYSPDSSSAKIYKNKLEQYKRIYPALQIIYKGEK